MTTFSSHTRTAPDFVAVAAAVEAAEFTAAGFAAAPGFICSATTNSREPIARQDTNTAAERYIPLCMVILPNESEILSQST
jgi:hypothetical protein